LKGLDSGFRRNDEKPHFQTFYEIILIGRQEINAPSAALVAMTAIA
jgi:hypothetical protein